MTELTGPSDNHLIAILLGLLHNSPDLLKRRSTDNRSLEMPTVRARAHADFSSLRDEQVTEAVTPHGRGDIGTGKSRTLLA